MYESAESDIQGAYVGAPCKLICVRKAATAAQLVVARSRGGTTLSAEGQYVALIHISEPTRPLYLPYAVFYLKNKRRLLLVKNHHFVIYQTH